MTSPIPKATVRRLPIYLRFLEECGPNTPTVGSEDIARATHGSAVQVRKDLSHVRCSGVRGVGYEVDELRQAIAKALGLGVTRRVALIGAGNLGTALAGYPGFPASGFRICSVYDKNPRRVGMVLNGMAVRHVSRLLQDAVGEPYEIGVIATPAAAAREVADLLVEARVGAILNFAGVTVQVPPEITVRNVDLATEFRILSYYLT